MSLQSIFPQRALPYGAYGHGTVAIELTRVAVTARARSTYRA